MAQFIDARVGYKFTSSLYTMTRKWNVYCILIVSRILNNVRKRRLDFSQTMTLNMASYALSDRLELYLYIFMFCYYEKQFENDLKLFHATKVKSCLWQYRVSNNDRRAFTRFEASRKSSWLTMISKYLVIKPPPRNKYVQSLWRRKFSRQSTRAIARPFS